MAAQNYDESLTRVLQHEGGYSNDPRDPGGATNFGITIADYRMYVKPDATPADVRAMKVAEAKTIYRAKYWDAQHCDDLPGGVDYAVFDYGVNSGIGRSAKVLQRIVGAPIDGKIGPATVAATQTQDAKRLVAAICDERLTFLKGLRTWSVFGPGWGRRVVEVRTVALRMAGQGPAVVDPQAPPPKPAPVKIPPPPDIHPIDPKPSQPASRGLFAALAAIVRAVFGRKS